MVGIQIKLLEKIGNKSLLEVGKLTKDETQPKSLSVIGRVAVEVISTCLLQTWATTVPPSTQLNQGVSIIVSPFKLSRIPEVLLPNHECGLKPKSTDSCMTVYCGTTLDFAS